MTPIDVYQLHRRPWWRRRWQVELTVADPPNALRAWTEVGAWRRGRRMWERYAAQEHAR